MPFKDPERRKAYVKEHYQLNSERIKQKSRQYHAEHRDEALDYRRKHYREHRAEYYERQAIWKAANPEKARDVKARYREKHRDKLRAAGREYNEKHKDRLSIKKRLWKRMHPELVRFQANLRNARLRLAGGKHTKEDELAIWERQKHKCAVPGCVFPISDKGENRYHVDHVKAVKNGGTNDKSNLQILCRQHNATKHARDEYEWAQQHGVLFL